LGFADRCADDGNAPVPKQGHCQLLPRGLHGSRVPGRFRASARSSTSSSRGSSSSTCPNRTPHWSRCRRGFGPEAGSA
jgi:hypothetical protein